MTGFVSPDPLNNLTNLFQRPEFIQADRAPTINDVKPPGTQWGDNATPIQNLYETPGRGIWILFASGGSPINTINSIVPIGGNFQIVANQTIPLIPDAIQINSPATQGPANSIGIKVLVDNLTMTINASGQLVASAVANALTQVTVDSGAPNPVIPVANNLNLFGIPGAIDFSGGPAGQINATVVVDNSTIIINGANQLQATNTSLVTTTTVGVGPADLFTLATVAGQTFYIEADIIGTDATGAFIAGGKQQAIMRNNAGLVTAIDIQNQFNATNPVSPPSGDLDFNFVSPLAANIVLRVFGSSAVGPITMNWKARVSYVLLP